MLDLDLRDGASSALAAMPERLRDALADKATMLTAALQAKIQDKLSGGVLNQKSGALARSIVSMMSDDTANVTVSIASTDVKYAAIHEFGGVIPPHQIVPDKAKVLAFLVSGKLAFAAHANLPAIAMPERSYMRSSLDEMADEIRDGLSEAMVGTMG